MKPRLAIKHNVAMTLFEVGVVVAVVIILVAIFLPRAANKHSPEIVCVNNLKWIGLAYKVWAGDNNDILPMGVSVTNGGSMGLVVTGDVASTFEVMSDELSTAKILICPADLRSPAINFTALTSSNISYFVGVDVTNDSNPELIISGDANLEFGGMPVKSGLRSFWTNDPVGWSTDRHIRKGNIGLADGSVLSGGSNQLHSYFIETKVATNRLAIP